METIDHLLAGGKKLARLSTLVGFIAGVIWVLGVRVLLFNPPVTHYHANFAVYVDGVKQELKDPSYFEEIASCSTTHAADPKSRVHLHNQNAHLIHVHDEAATWGHLFANLGMTVGTNILKTREATLLDAQDGKKLVFYLNGETVPTLANRVIGSEDVLVVAYGTPETNAAIKSWYEAVPRDAAESNTKPDPSSCSGPGNFSFTDRVKQALDFTK